MKTLPTVRLMLLFYSRGEKMSIMQCYVRVHPWNNKWLNAIINAGETTASPHQATEGWVKQFKYFLQNFTKERCRRLKIYACNYAQ